MIFLILAYNYFLNNFYIIFQVHLNLLNYTLKNQNIYI